MFRISIFLLDFETFHVNNEILWDCISSFNPKLNTLQTSYTQNLAFNVPGVFFHLCVRLDEASLTGELSSQRSEVSDSGFSLRDAQSVAIELAWERTETHRQGSDKAPASTLGCIPLYHVICWGNKTGERIAHTCWCQGWLQLFFHFIFWESLSELDPVISARLIEQQAPRILLSPTLTCGVKDTCGHMQLFVGTGDLNWGPLTY